MTMLSRRDLLGALGAATVGAISLPQLARALERHGVARPPIGLQLYTVRGLMQRDVDGTLEALAAAGVREVEFAGYFNRTPRDLRSRLDALGLTSPAVHVPLQATPEGWDAAFDAAATIGHRWCVIPWVGNDVRASLDSWRRLADTLNEAGRRAASAGCASRITITISSSPSSTASSRTMSFVDATRCRAGRSRTRSVLGGEGGAGSRAMFAKRPGRFPLWHLKDAGPAPQRAMRDVGAGTIDFTALFAAGAQAGLRHAFIEHDNPPDPMASVRASAAALSRVP
jgi:sugar phosphate isomerase/epimerase